MRRRGQTCQLVDFFFAVGGRSSRGLDHGGGLHIGELLDAALAGDHVADLQGKVGVFLLLTHLQARQVRVATGGERDTVIGEGPVLPKHLDHLGASRIHLEALNLTRHSLSECFSGRRHLSDHLCIFPL